MKILKERGITLVALVITIIVLLILAGVTLSLVLGDNGVVTKADEAKTTSNQKEVEEQLKLKVQEYLANNDGEFNRAGFLSTLTEFTNNGDNTVTKDGVTLSIGTKGEIAIVNNNSNEYGTLTTTIDISENRDTSVILDYYEDSKTAVISGSGTIGQMYGNFALMGVDIDRIFSDQDYVQEFTSTHQGANGKWNLDYPAETLIFNNSTISYNAFGSCDSIKNIEFSNDVTTIENDAFIYCDSLTSVSIPNSVTSIGRHAFCGCNVLTEIYLTENIETIGEEAFYMNATVTTIYCQTQSVADLVNASGIASKTTIIVDPSKF